jgi:D-arabinose 1-dehydrogenase-like Zn-dependent alcohol dehydrogenase
MKVCSICNSDNKLKEGLIKSAVLPVIPGHEPAGEVVEIGRDVTEVKVGDHVTFLHYVSCGHCKNCLSGRINDCLVGFKRLGYEMNGGYAEYMLAPAKNALVVPKDMPFEHAALIPDAICTSVHALYDRAKVQPGEVVLISGVGGLGIHGMQVAKALGCTVIVSDPDERKLQRARELGADYTFSPLNTDIPEKCRELTNGFGVDVAADFVGLPVADETAFASLAIAGRFVMVGYQPRTTFNVSSEWVTMGEREIIGSKNRLPHNMKMGLQFVLEGKVKPQVDEKFHFTQANEALAKLKKVGFIGRGVLTMD